MATDQKQKFESRYKRIIEQNIKGFSKSNLGLLSDFFKLLQSEGISYSRQYKYLVLLPIIIEDIDKDIIDLNKDDLIELAGKIRSKDYRESTKVDFLGSVKKVYASLSIMDKYKSFDSLYIWLYDKRNKFYSTNIDSRKDKAKKYWFNDDDVMQIIEKARSLRNKTIFSLLATQGMRPGELLTIKQKDITDNGNDEVQLEISGKTGVRTLYVQEDYVIKYLREYIRTQNDNPNRLLFKITDKRLNDILKEICKEINLNKPVNLYKFRHFSITRDRIKGLSAGALEQKYGWVKGSKRIAVYDKSTGSDYRKEIRQVSGKDVSSIKESKFEKVMGSKSMEQELRELRKNQAKMEEWIKAIYEKFGSPEMRS
jgi:integrase